MKRRPDPNQLLIDCAKTQPPKAVAVIKDAQDGTPAESVSGEGQSPPPLVQRLPWDFKRTFPEPLEEAIEAGVLDETDRELENLRELHDCHARQCIAALKSLDVVMDARRRGIDPATGRPPRTRAAKERLQKYLQEEPARPEHAFRVMIETYEGAFGPNAADAFEKAVRAWHAGIDVIAEGSSRPGRQMTIAQVSRSELAGRLSSALPVPKPLPEAIAAGRFGYQEDGKPVKAGPHEVRAITENYVEKIIDLIETMVAQRPDTPQVDEAAAKLKAALDAYAEDFGTPAALQLERHARRQAALSRGGR